METANVDNDTDDDDDAERKENQTVKKYCLSSLQIE